MNSEKVKEIKELLRCLNGEKACTNCYINEIAKERETFCINVIADMTLDLINELESENERLNKSDTSKEESSIEYYNLYKGFKRKNKDLNELCERQRISIAESFVKENQLKDRIAELEHKCDDCAGCTQWKCDCANIEMHAVEQFAERLKEKMTVHYPSVIDSIDETLKEFIEC